MDMLNWSHDFDLRRERWKVHGEPDPHWCPTEHYMWIKWSDRLAQPEVMTEEDARLYYVQRLFAFRSKKFAPMARYLKITPEALKSWLRGEKPLSARNAALVDGRLKLLPDYDVPAEARGNWPRSFVDACI